MELIGEIAEERELTGDESLATLVDIFTEEKVVLAEGMFLQVKNSFIESVAQKQEKIKSAVVYLRNELPLPSQESDIRDALNSLAADYICLEMGLKYDRISSQLFRLRRAINGIIDEVHTKKAVDLAIPLFADVSFGKSIWKLEEACDVEGHKYKLKIESKAPPITKEVKEKAKQVMADYMGICFKALRNTGISDLIFRDISSTASLDLRMYWIPSPSELKIQAERIDKDPILVANVYGRNYLVASWNVRGEEPFEHYVQEFTEEKAKV